MKHFYVENKEGILEKEVIEVKIKLLDLDYKLLLGERKKAAF